MPAPAVVVDIAQLAHGPDPAGLVVAAGPELCAAAVELGAVVVLVVLHFEVAAELSAAGHLDDMVEWRRAIRNQWVGMVIQILRVPHRSTPARHLTVDPCALPPAVVASLIVAALCVVAEPRFPCCRLYGLPNLPNCLAPLHQLKIL